MKLPFSSPATHFNADAIHATIQRALGAAGLDTRTGPMREVTDTIRRALAGGPPPAAAPSASGASVIDIAARPLPADDDKGAQDHAANTGGARQQTGRFQTFSFSNAAGTRAYKVYTPPGHSDVPRAVIVMLHGCTQCADDFAAGTQMNRLADEHGFLVVYPEQTAQANASKCWNWFKPQDQLRDAGEPSLIAGIVCEVVRTQAADSQRVYVAGLSAGAAMAVVLGETYPELFAAVGAHSGLPYGSAHDIPSALAAMKGGRGVMPGLRNARGATGAVRRSAVQAVPLIVFHGDRDHTVQQANAADIVQQARAAHDAHAVQQQRSAPAGDTGLRVSRQSGAAAGGRRYSREVHADAQGRARIEHWTLHGAGHAWSGGHASGSYTDGSGPDASAEMVRFFLGLPGPGPAG